jgi:hypothetical protein
MVRLAIPLVVAAVVFMIYAVVDCALFDRLRIRGLSRGWWIVVILLVPLIGAVLWFVIGRGRAGRGARAGGARNVSGAPDDDTDFLRRLGRDAEQEERIRRLEQELADLDSELDASIEQPETPHEDPPGGSLPGPGHPESGPTGGTPHRPDRPDAGDPGTTGRPNA